MVLGSVVALRRHGGCWGGGGGGGGGDILTWSLGLGVMSERDDNDMGWDGRVLSVELSGIT